MQSSHRIQRLAKTEGGPSQVRRRQIGHQRIARRPPDPLADAVGEARREHIQHRLGKGEQRLHHRGQAIARSARYLRLRQRSLKMPENSFDT